MWKLSKMSFYNIKNIPMTTIKINCKAKYLVNMTTYCLKIINYKKYYSGYLFVFI